MGATRCCDAYSVAVSWNVKCELKALFGSNSALQCALCCIHYTGDVPLYLCNVILTSLTEFLRNFAYGNGETATETRRPPTEPAAGIWKPAKRCRHECCIHWLYWWCIGESSTSLTIFISPQMSPTCHTFGSSNPPILEQIRIYYQSCRTADRRTLLLLLFDMHKAAQTRTGTIKP